MSGPEKARLGITISGVSLALLATMFPLVQSAVEAANRTTCKCRLKQIGLAMFNYQDAHGAFPPGAIRDANGRPHLSWRVAILPFLEEQGVYEQFHLDEPWDSPHNLPLASQMPEQFRCPSDRSAKDNAANYVIAIGSETFFPPEGQVSIKDVLDGTSLTIMVGEVIGKTSPWTKPDDPIFDPQFSARGTFISAHARGWQALMGDGTCRFIRSDVPEQVVRGLMTIAGGESIREEDF